LKLPNGAGRRRDPSPLEKTAMTVRGLRRSLVLLGCAAALAGCSKSATFPAELAGAYKLTTVNGSAPPYQLPGLPTGTAARLEGGSLVILDNGRFDEKLNYFLVTPDKPAGDPAQAETIGDVSASAGNMTFKPRFEDSWTATYTANTITYTKVANSNVSVTLVFTRGS
jgi:hypothetical protein